MPATRLIPLTKGQHALVDDTDFDALVRIGRWCFSNSGYAIHYYTDDNGQRKVLYMHRVIMERAQREIAHWEARTAETERAGWELAKCLESWINWHSFGILAAMKIGRDLRGACLNTLSTTWTGSGLWIFDSTPGQIVLLSCGLRYTAIQARI